MAGETCVAVAKAYDLPVDSVERHKRKHLIRSQSATATNFASTPIELLRQSVEEFDKLSHEAKLRNDIRTSADMAVRKLAAIERLLDLETQEREREAKRSDKSSSTGIPLEYFDRMMDIARKAEEKCDTCPTCGMKSLPKPYGEQADSVN